MISQKNITKNSIIDVTLGIFLIIILSVSSLVNHYDVYNFIVAIIILSNKQLIFLLRNKIVYFRKNYLRSIVYLFGIFLSILSITYNHFFFNYFMILSMFAIPVILIIISFFEKKSDLIIYKKVDLSQYIVFLISLYVFVWTHFFGLGLSTALGMICVAFLLIIVLLYRSISKRNLRAMILLLSFLLLINMNYTSGVLLLLTSNGIE